LRQNKVNIEALKEKHILDMEIKEKEYSHQIEIMKLQHSNEMKKEEENVKNQFAVSALGGLFNGIFSKDSPISGKLNEAIEKSLDEAMKNKQEQ